MLLLLLQQVLIANIQHQVKLKKKYPTSIETHNGIQSISCSSSFFWRAYIHSLMCMGWKSRGRICEISVFFVVWPLCWFKFHLFGFCYIFSNKLKNIFHLRVLRPPLTPTPHPSPFNPRPSLPVCIYSYINFEEKLKDLFRMVFVTILVRLNFQGQTLKTLKR